MIPDPRETIASLAAHGVQLRIGPDGQLLWRGPDIADLPGEAAASYRAAKPAIVQYLRLEGAWNDAIVEVGSRWESAGQPGWFDDVDLADRVGDALRAVDAEACRDAISRWRAAWLGFLETAQRAEGSR